jgi:hypothetical protein
VILGVTENECDFERRIIDETDLIDLVFGEE